MSEIPRCLSPFPVSRTRVGTAVGSTTPAQPPALRTVRNSCAPQPAEREADPTRELNRIALLRERERGTGKHLPVVATTAHAMKGDREACEAAGMDAYISKPIQPLELFRVLARLFPVPIYFFRAEPTQLWLQILPWKPASRLGSALEEAVAEDLVRWFFDLFSDLHRAIYMHVERESF